MKFKNLYQPIFDFDFLANKNLKKNIILLVIYFSIDNPCI